MKIQINGVDADVQPETEKTVGEVLCAMDTWFAGMGYRLSGLDIDGETISSGSMETCFHKNIDTIDTLDIKASPLLELFAECLFRLIQDIDTYAAAGFEEKGPFAEYWRETPEARLLAEQSRDLFDRTAKTFSGEGADPQSLRILIEERLRELQDPEKEMTKTGPVVEEVCSRLEELPLDIQTGKDTRAAETVSIFSGIAEKVFRIFNLLKTKGFPVGEITVANMPVAAYITEFGTALRELLAAYEQHDTVLVGDIAEYEMAPRLRSLHGAVLDGITRRRS